MPSGFGAGRGKVGGNLTNSVGAIFGRRDIWSFLVTGCLGTIVVLATISNRPKPPHEIDQTHSGTNRSDQEPGTGQPPIRPRQAIEVHWTTEERDHHGKERFYWWLAAVLTFFVAVGALGTVYLTDLGWQEARKATKEARKATADAERQAKAAEDAVNVSVSAERGRLFVISATLIRSSERDPNPRVSYAVINLGRTGIIIMQFWSECYVTVNSFPLRSLLQDKRRNQLYGRHAGWRAIHHS